MAKAENQIQAKQRAKQPDNGESKQPHAQERSDEAPERQHDETHSPHEPVERFAVGPCRAMPEVRAHFRVCIGMSRWRTEAWASVQE